MNGKNYLNNEKLKFSIVQQVSQGFWNSELFKSNIFIVLFQSYFMIIVFLTSSKQINNYT